MQRPGPVDDAPDEVLHRCDPENDRAANASMTGLRRPCQIEIVLNAERLMRRRMEQFLG
jgi:hypothetical protein